MDRCWNGFFSLEVTRSLQISNLDLFLIYYAPPSLCVKLYPGRDSEEIRLSFAVLSISYSYLGNLPRILSHLVALVVGLSLFSQKDLLALHSSARSPLQQESDAVLRVAARVLGGGYPVLVTMGHFCFVLFTSEKWKLLSLRSLNRFVWIDSAPL